MLSKFILLYLNSFDKNATLKVLFILSYSNLYTKVKSCPFIEVKFFNLPFNPSLVLLNNIVAISTDTILVFNVICSLHFLGFVQCINFNE